ncbi:hypothetical protein PHYSODRAFT_292923 [Phytophthora sojae]|uniref:Uncharacterized protein n=1 Tax=Phytophthora sojae (strain P6497) TaxID=1094619 RepID=G4YJR8_PHYSP|nr:hypothetical protein PHYSODRAFT_292923 [Phytophthora sojae]EGZ26625.1 hypothetical protein PHYSODRAFT_292923 [Phytophthora sojae]|eukprot:XP_009513900.1 hypothetical protein PHYSODRAFT_292923 [Phytophthora sojae]
MEPTTIKQGCVNVYKSADFNGVAPQNVGSGGYWSEHVPLNVAVAVSPSESADRLAGVAGLSFSTEAACGLARRFCFEQFVSIRRPRRLENEQFEDRNSASIANLEKGTSMLDRPIEFHGFGVEWWIRSDQRVVGSGVKPSQLRGADGIFRIEIRCRRSELFGVRFLGIHSPILKAGRCSIQQKGIRYLSQAVGTYSSAELVSRLPFTLSRQMMRAQPIMKSRFLHMKNTPAVPQDPWLTTDYPQFNLVVPNIPFGSKFKLGQVDTFASAHYRKGRPNESTDRLAGMVNLDFEGLRIVIVRFLPGFSFLTNQIMMFINYRPVDFVLGASSVFPVPGLLFAVANRASLNVPQAWKTYFTAGQVDIIS